MRFISNRFFFFSIISICLLWSNIFQSEAQVSAGTLSATVDVDSRSVCQNGTQPIITFTGAGGSAPYTFSYTINGIEQTAVSSASESTVTANVPTTEAGSFTYTLTKVTDKNNKSQDISSQIVNIIINALPSISGITHICELEQTTTLQSASLPAASLAWTGPDGFTATTVAISGLKPGDYTLTVSDNGGFPFVHTYTITQPNDIIIFTDSKKDITCNGSNNGSIAISVTGGTLPYAYLWTKNGQAYASTQNITALSPGTYEVAVSDANHCGPKTMTYTITEPTAITSSVVKQTNVLCYGNATGAISVDVTGGTATEITSGIFDYGYSWKDGLSGYLFLYCLLYDGIRH